MSEINDKLEKLIEYKEDGVEVKKPKKTKTTKTVKTSTKETKKTKPKKKIVKGGDGNYY